MGKTDYYAKGQKDGAVNKFDSPIDPVGVLFTGASKQDLENEKTYKDGYHNASKQRKQPVNHKETYSV